MAQPEPASVGPVRSHRFGRLVTALAAGVAGGLLAPLLYPTIARNARPAAKRVLKTGIGAFERGRVAAAEFAEHASDLLAESRAEYDEEQAVAMPHDKPGAASEVVALHGPGREAAGT